MARGVGAPIKHGSKPLRAPADPWENIRSSGRWGTDNSFFGHGHSCAWLTTRAWDSHNGGSILEFGSPGCSSGGTDGARFGDPLDSARRTFIDALGLLLEDLHDLYTRTGREVVYLREDGSPFPYWPKRYLQALRRAEAAGDVVVWVEQLVMKHQSQDGLDG